MLIDYLGSRSSFDTDSNPNWVAYQSILGGLTEPSEFAGKIVIVGIANDQPGDTVATPFGMVPGMLVHANVIATLLSPQGPPPSLSGHAAAGVALIASLVIVIPLLFLPMWGSLMIALVEIAVLGLLGEYVFREFHTVMGLSAPIMGIVFTVNGIGYYEYRRARHVLGRFVGRSEEHTSELQSHSF